MTTTPALFVVHPGSGTIVAADECALVRTDDYDKLATDTAAGHVGPMSEQPIPDPGLIVSFEPEAIRGHYAEIAGDPAAVAAARLTDDELREIAERAMTDDRIWIAFRDVLDSAILDRAGND